MTCTDFFAAIPHLNVLVVGDVMLDSYLWGKVERISPEAPVPVVNLKRTERRLGGAANVARNVKSLGAMPWLCAVVGDDEEGKTLLELLQKEGMPTEGILQSTGRPTTIKHRILSGSQHLLRIDAEVTDPLPLKESAALVERVKKIGERADVLIFEDYDKGVLTKKNIQELIAWAREKGIPTVVDPKKRNFLAYTGCTLFKPNLKELKEGLKTDFSVSAENLAPLENATSVLRTKLNAENVLITLSDLGVLAMSEVITHHIAAHKREIADVSGAGDTVVSVAAIALALGCSLEEVAALSNLSGGLVCEYSGVMPLPKDRFEAEIKRLGLLGE